MEGDNGKSGSTFRIGIDVGGTFTHAVAIDAQTLAVVGKAKVPTTHRAKEGVARGIVDSLLQLIRETNIPPDHVTFIAHSTTQATNALLEGDVAMVGILGMGSGTNAFFARSATRLGKVPISNDRYIDTEHTFLDTSNGIEDEAVKNAIDSLVKNGAQAIAISEGFAVDQPENEAKALKIARGMGLLATSGSEVSQLYGLRVRTRTAVINASMLPKMIESAEMTELSVRDAGIKAPVMIMRSDGGVMDIQAMREKPLLTMLSGPAAGVAAATMFLHISDGIFLEVGGTSTDISVIANGRALVKSGEIGGNKVYMRTLDIHTLGIAGGSMSRLSGGNIVAVGPRSAHKAGLGYVAFTDKLEDARIETVQPLPTDPSDYLAIASGSEKPNLTLTPTCAANLLGFVSEGDCARGNLQTIEQGFQLLGTKLGVDAKEAAGQILAISAQKCIPTVKSLLKEYKLDAEIVTLVGGGGGAAAIVPYLAKELNMKFTLADHADVVSAIGVALALIRETVERQVLSPSKEEILRIRNDARTAVERMGADPKTVEVHLEIDSRTNTLRATAYGATKIAAGGNHKKELSETEQIDLVASSMRVTADKVKLAAATDFFRVFTATLTRSRLLGLLEEKKNAFRVVDQGGSIRLQSQNGYVSASTAKEAEALIAKTIESYAQWGDAGKIIPNITVLSGARIIDLSGLLDTDQVVGRSQDRIGEPAAGRKSNSPRPDQLMSKHRLCFLP